jgi:hypothetical protein
MKKSLALMLGLLLPVCLFTLPSEAKLKIPDQETTPERTLADCQAGLAELELMVSNLTVTKAKDTQKVHKDLLKLLYKAEDKLDSDKTKDLVNAAEAIDDFWNALIKLADKGKVDGFEADDITFAAWDVEDCIVELFYPDWNILDDPDSFPFPDFPWF